MPTHCFNDLYSTGVKIAVAKPVQETEDAGRGEKMAFGELVVPKRVGFEEKVLDKMDDKPTDFAQRIGFFRMLLPELIF